MPCLLMTLLLLLQGAAELPSHIVVDGRVEPGALVFLLVSWTCVLGLTAWAFAKILRVQARRATPSSPDEPTSVDGRLPPTA